MSEFRTIQVQVFHDKNGQATCCSDWENREMCMFLQTRRMGFQEVCGATATDLDRDEGGAGYLRPHDACPIWKQ